MDSSTYNATWTQSYPIPAGIWTSAQLAYHLRLDPDVAASSDETAYLTDLQNAAVEFAENALGSSLLTRTITAVYFGQNAPSNFGYQFLSPDAATPKLRLPRGPIVSITSVNDAKGSIATWQLQGEGTQDLLQILTGYVTPVTIVYQAGYGSTAASIPADIRQALRMHIGTMYENRESVGKDMAGVPHSLADFYRLRSRNLPVG